MSETKRGERFPFSITAVQIWEINLSSEISLRLLSVYDGTYTVPDYSIYIVTGVTCSLAWALPSLPFYPDLELMESYESGHLPLLLDRNDENNTDTNQNLANAVDTVHGLPNVKVDHRLMLNLLHKFLQATSIRRQQGVSNTADNRDGLSSVYERDRHVDSYYFRIHRNTSPTANYFNSESTPSKNILSWKKPINEKYYESEYYSDAYSVEGNTNIGPIHKSPYDGFAHYIAQTYVKPWIEGGVMQTAV